MMKLCSMLERVEVWPAFGTWVDLGQLWVKSVPQQLGAKGMALFDFRQVKLPVVGQVVWLEGP